MLPTVTLALLRTPCLQPTLKSNAKHGKIVNDKLRVTRRNFVRLVALGVNTLEEENVKEMLLRFVDRASEYNDSLFLTTLCTNSLF